MLDPIFSKEYLVNLTTSLKVMNNTTHKNASTQFSISSTKTCIEKKRNLMSKQERMTAKPIKKPVLKHGTNMSIEMNQLFWICSMDNSSLELAVINVIEFLLYLIHF